jgi:uncharacterized iron-regulated protein
MKSSFLRAWTALGLVLALGACRTAPWGGARTRIVETSELREVSLDEAADLLARCDVVFLGEEHDNDAGHRAQLELFERLIARRPRAALSLEQFERDTQAELDRYRAGEISERRFLAHSRPWPNYARHYRPLIELARERGLFVIAANVPRPLASRVSREGLEAVRDEPFMPREVVVGSTAYRRRFAAAMQREPLVAGDPALELWFTAQCVKDEAMAESIADFLRVAPYGTLVVHLCGKFHSDARLGTVERLERRAPWLSIGVVTMVSGVPERASLPDEARANADFVLLVPAQR